MRASCFAVLAGTAIVMVLVAVVSVRVARAEPTPDPIALELFAEGRRLLATGDNPHACEKFEAARRRVPWLGVELNLADCYERLGKTASAWAMFHHARDKADRQHDARAAYARMRADLLEPDLARITVESTDSTELRLDGAPITASVALPVDPGDHVIAASAHGHRSWSIQITALHRVSRVIVVPALDALPAPVPPPNHTRYPWLALSIGAIGAATLGTAFVLAIDGKRDFDRAARDHCTPQLVCDRVGYDAIRAARRQGNTATILGGMGLVTAGAAVILYFAPRRELAPIVTPTTLGVAVQGTL